MSVSFEIFIAEMRAKRSGDHWRCPCPAHFSKHNSQTLWFTQCPERGIGLYCHAKCKFEDIVDHLKVFGLWPVEPPDGPVVVEDAASVARRFAAINRIIDEGRDAENTRVELYLRARGITLPIPEVLGYHPKLWHKDTQTSWPSMLALVRRVPGAWAAVHRTWLTQIGPARKAPIDPPRMSLGPTKGAHIPLAPAGQTLIIGEGIETTLSVMQETGLPGWAAISAGNMVHIDLPEAVRRVIIAADGDDVGETAAQLAGVRWKRQGLDVRIMRAPPGLDFNDVLQGKMR